MADDTPTVLPSTRAQGWLGVLMPVMEKATPITLLVLLILGGATLYYQNAEVSRLHDSQRTLMQLILEAKDKQVELALRIGQCESKHTEQWWLDDEMPTAWQYPPRESKQCL